MSIFKGFKDIEDSLIHLQLEKYRALQKEQRCWPYCSNGDSVANQFCIWVNPPWGF